MATLSGLKLVAVQHPTEISPVQQRRNKLIRRLNEQSELAAAREAGATYAPLRLRTVRDAQTGQRREVESAIRVKPWWFTADNGKLVLSVRYGTKLLELAKGKWAVEVGTQRELIPVLDLLKSAVGNGELDSAIEVAAKKMRQGFGKQ